MRPRWSWAFVPIIELVVGGCQPQAEDLLLLRDGSQRRGALSSCDPGGCRLDAESVPRASIEWIGLGRTASAPPPVRDPAHDELHLLDASVQTGVWTRIDSERVEMIPGDPPTGAASVPRDRVAWIHLGQTLPPPEPETGGPTSDETTDDDGEDDESGDEETESGEDRADDRADPGAGAGAWRLPQKIYVWLPSRCATCASTLHVLQLETDDDGILLAKSRTISISDDAVEGYWYTYRPPVPMFPASIEAGRLAYDGESATDLMVSFYRQNRGRPGSTHRPAPAADRAEREQPPEPASPNRGLEGHLVDLSLRLAREKAVEYWREQMSRPVSSPGIGGRRQHAEQTGAASYRHLLRISNWPAIAAELSASEAYRRLRQIPVYDVVVDLRFEHVEPTEHARDVDPDGYTIDRMLRWRQASVAPGPRPLPSAAPRPATALEQVDELTGLSTRRTRERAEDWIRDRLAADRQALRAGAAPGAPGPAPQDVRRHAMHLEMRWLRAEGRITPHNASDVVQDVIEGRPEPTRWLVSGTLPAGAFDIREPPQWTPENPKPEPETPDFHFQP
jgi:hypothetical protein